MEFLSQFGLGYSFDSIVNTTPNIPKPSGSKQSKKPKPENVFFGRHALEPKVVQTLEHDFFKKYRLNFKFYTMMKNDKGEDEFTKVKPRTDGEDVILCTGCTRRHCTDGDCSEASEAECELDHCEDHEDVEDAAVQCELIDCGVSDAHTSEPLECIVKHFDSSIHMNRSDARDATHFFSQALKSSGSKDSLFISHKGKLTMKDCNGKFQVVCSTSLKDGNYKFR